MAISYLKSKKIDIPLWVKVEEVESQALDQLRNVAELPWTERMAVMPDVHYGAGATVGSVIASKGAITPAAVGVDIGCGMGATRTNLDAKKIKRKAVEIRKRIEEVIPVGFNSHSSPIYIKAPGYLEILCSALMNEYDLLIDDARVDPSRALHQLGTLGGGNHFIEISEGSDGSVWFVLHSGSRHAGKCIADAHIKRAIELSSDVKLPDKMLSRIPDGTNQFEEFMRDLSWAQSYAMVNRVMMMWLLTEVMKEFFPGIKTTDEIWCHHNYVDMEEDLYVTRKGAISARKGEKGIIPGAMGAKSYIVRGLGNEEALFSAPHGAGRKMSRGKAKKKFSKKDIIEQTKGVECRKDTGIADELMGAYKPIKKVMDYCGDLVEIIVELKPAMICVKG